VNDNAVSEMHPFVKRDVRMQMGVFADGRATANETKGFDDGPSRDGGMIFNDDIRADGGVGSNARDGRNDGSSVDAGRGSFAGQDQFGSFGKSQLWRIDAHCGFARKRYALRRDDADGPRGLRAREVPLAVNVDQVFGAGGVRRSQR
jgi:hypothetical protein